MPICQLFWHVVCTVQTIPFTFCIVAALVTVVISIMVFAVLVIKWAEKRTRHSLYIYKNPNIQTFRVHLQLSILTCIVLPVLGNQTHHTGTQGCCTGRHTSHHWNIASTAEQQSSFARDRQSSVSSLRRPSHRHGCCTVSHRCGCPPTRHTEESHSSPPLLEVGWCRDRNLQ